MGEGTSCLFTVPVIVMAPTAVFCSVPVAAAVCSRFQLFSKLASSDWLLPSLEACVLSLRSPFAKLLALTKASPSATSLLPCLWYLLSLTVAQCLHLSLSAFLCFVAISQC